MGQYPVPHFFPVHTAPDGKGHGSDQLAGVVSGYRDAD